MDWQQVLSLSIVAATALAFVARGGDGASSVSNATPTVAARLAARRSEVPLSIRRRRASVRA
jgi:hypothetical protein